MPLLPVAAALAAALLIGLGFVLQQHAAAAMPDSVRLSFRLLGSLVRRPVWLLGIAFMVGGQLLGALALSAGSLALVEPIMATNLLFALPISALWHRRRVVRRDWISAIGLLGGLAAFVAAGSPHGGHAFAAPWTSLALATGTIVAVGALLVYIGRRLHRKREASLLASAAGLGYGLQDALTRRTELHMTHSVLGAFTSWTLFVLVGVAVVSILLNQSAFEAGPLPLSLPPVTAGEPLTGIALGVGVYGERLNLSWPSLLAETAGLALMIAALCLLARSALITGEPALPG